MAKAKVKFPLDSIAGVIAGPDRTIGRDVGMASSIRRRVNATAGTAQPDLKVQIYATTAPTRGGSTARHARSTVYCDCDGSYKTLAPEKQVFLVPWWRSATGGAFVSMGAYQVYMKTCLKGLLEFKAFLVFSYLTRYQIVNNDPFDWEEEEAILTNIPFNPLYTQSLEVFLLLNSETKKGTISYSAKMVDTPLDYAIIDDKTITVFVPLVQRQSSVFIDVYSYWKG
jgi:hypothetical protein